MKYVTNSTGDYRYNFYELCDEDYLSILKQLLKEFELEEDYEACAEIRDEILKIQNDENR